MNSKKPRVLKKEKMKIWQTNICQAFFDLKSTPTQITQNAQKISKIPPKKPQKHHCQTSSIWLKVLQNR